jgi:hypothetical protein
VLKAKPVYFSKQHGIGVFPKVQKVEQTRLRVLMQLSDKELSYKSTQLNETKIYLKTGGSAGKIHTATYSTYPITWCGYGPAPIRRPCNMFKRIATSWLTTAVMTVGKKCLKYKQ